MIKIIEDKCDYCGSCVTVCPTDCIELDHNDRSTETPGVDEGTVPEMVAPTTEELIEAPAVIRKAAATKKYYIVDPGI